MDESCADESRYAAQIIVNAVREPSLRHEEHYERLSQNLVLKFLSGDWQHEKVGGFQHVTEVCRRRRKPDTLSSINSPSTPQPNSLRATASLCFLGYSPCSTGVFRHLRLTFAFFVPLVFNHRTATSSILSSEDWPSSVSSTVPQLPIVQRDNHEVRIAPCSEP